MTHAQRLTSIRLYPGQDDDLINWWNALPGNRTEAVKAAIRRGLETGNTAPTLDLAAIRGVIDAALEARLQGLALAPTTPQTNEEAEGLLNALGADLLI